MVTGWGWILCQPPEDGIAAGGVVSLVVGETVGMAVDETLDAVPWAMVTWGISGTAAVIIPANTADSKPGISFAPILASGFGIVLRRPGALPCHYLSCTTASLPAAVRLVLSRLRSHRTIDALLFCRAGEIQATPRYGLEAVSGDRTNSSETILLKPMDEGLVLAPFHAAMERKASSEILDDCMDWMDVDAFLPNDKLRTFANLMADWLEQDLMASPLLSTPAVANRCAMKRLPGSLRLRANLAFAWA